jgi:ssDNA-binding Zn-finger/Zn-ribbon topoisomerase 1
VVLFSQIENPINSSCPVTLDRFQPDSRVTQLVSCGHIFTPSGINSWLQTNVRCPVCRNDIRLLASRNEETKEEEHLEETKTYDAQEERSENMNMNPPPQSLSAITESLLENLFSPTVTSQMMDISQNSFFYDSSNNQIVFEGFLRRSRL